MGREIQRREPQHTDGFRVSIRSRLLGREIRFTANTATSTTLFQSAPGFWAGRYTPSAGLPCPSSRFQSAPGFWAGRYWDRPTVVWASGEFQSAPGFWAGRYIAWDRDADCIYVFQSAPGFWAGRYGFKFQWGESVCVSIRSRLLGREIPGIKIR